MELFALLLVFYKLIFLYIFPCRTTSQIWKDCITRGSSPALQWVNSNDDAWNNIFNTQINSCFHIYGETLQMNRVKRNNRWLGNTFSMVVFINSRTEIWIKPSSKWFSERVWMSIHHSQRPTSTFMECWILGRIFKNKMNIKHTTSFLGRQLGASEAEMFSAERMRGNMRFYLMNTQIVLKDILEHRNIHTIGLNDLPFASF